MVQNYKKIALKFIRLQENKYKDYIFIIIRIHLNKIYVGNL